MKPQAFRDHATDLTELDYLNSPFLLPDEELLLKNDTSALLLHLEKNEGECINKFYSNVRSLYQEFSKLLNKFDLIKSDMFHLLKFLSPTVCQKVPKCLRKNTGKVVV